MWCVSGSRALDGVAVAQTGTLLAVGITAARARWLRSMCPGWPGVVPQFALCRLCACVRLCAAELCAVLTVRALPVRPGVWLLVAGTAARTAPRCCCS